MVLLVVYPERKLLGNRLTLFDTCNLKLHEDVLLMIGVPGSTLLANSRTDE